MSALAIASMLAAVTMSLLLAHARRALAEANRQRTALTAQSRQQQADAEAAEGLLRTVVEATPVAVVLFTDTGRIRFANNAARELFFASAPVEGQNFLSMLERAPQPMRRALLADGDELFTVEGDGDGETFHLSKRYFAIAGESHTLVAVKHMTQEIARQEIGTLKKVIRIISHEINNSLGPIASLVSSGRLIVKRPEHLPKLDVVFSTIDERTHHLMTFLDGYARLAKLPAPRPQPIAWGPFLQGIRALWPQIQIGPAPATDAYFDPAQIQQVLINIIKNASEAGGPVDSVSVQIERSEDGVRVTVLDRGAGLSDEVMQSALLPFFTTKANGSGLGLALCRDIVESHRGRLRLSRREGGGAAISFWLPDRETPTAALSGTRALLTLTNV